MALRTVFSTALAAATVVIMIGEAEAQSRRDRSKKR